MIVTLYLISANTYNSVDAPKDRGFSNIELWMLGTQFPNILALLEYGFILHLKKVAKKLSYENQIMDPDDQKGNLEDRIKKLYYASMIFSLISFIIFASVYSIHMI